MWIGRAWETFVGVLNEPHISKKRLLGSLKWKEGKNVDGINDKKKKRLFLHLHTVFVNPLIKGLTCRCRCQACTQSITYLSQEPHLEIRGCFVIFLKFFICCHSTTCMCTSLIMKTLTWLTFLQGQFDILCIGSDIDAALPLLGMLLPQTGMH